MISQTATPSRPPAPSGATAHPADRAVAAAAADLPAMSLTELVDLASLQVRLDRKYLVRADRFEELAAGLGPRLAALEIDGSRTFGYESVYFDTPALMTYHEHLRRRPDRFKLRTRSYLDSGRSMFEIKLSSPDGGTVKRRHRHPFPARSRITSRARAALAGALVAAGRPVPGRLAATCVTTYRRTTLVATDGSARLTCDHSLVFSDGDRIAGGPADHILVEVKSASPETAIDRGLAFLGVTPVSISKYCVGIALLNPGLPSDPWDELLEAHFDRRREGVTPL